VLGGVLKQVFARSRPEWPEAITVLTGYSFPSGHALNSMLAAGCVIVLVGPRLGPVARRWLWVACGAFVLLVGFDRVALGVHYLSDVLAGWSLALAVLFATLAAFGPFPVQPASAPDQPGDGPPPTTGRTHPQGSPSVPTDARPPPTVE
jgi:membrane-associated phospholipid phosphatase